MHECIWRLTSSCLSSLMYTHMSTCRMDFSAKYILHVQEDVLPSQRSSTELKKKDFLSEVFSIIWHRAIFPGLKTKYCNRGEA